jgi:hypothetical protein
VSDRARAAVFGGLVLVVVAVVAVVLLSLGGNQPAKGSADSATRALSKAEASGRSAAVVFRRSDGQIAVAPLAQTAGAATDAGLRCDRVAYNGTGGICLARGGGFAAGYVAEVLGPDLRVKAKIGVQGIPSRARVSRDGRYGTVTTFVTGDSYQQAGAFSTRATLIDMRQGREIANLEDFTVTRDGRQVTAVDVNYWGVTFDPRDSDRFWATLATGGKTYLIVGSIADRTAHTIHTNVECPSVSPDGTRIAYKKRTGPTTAPWRLTVLDLATMRETPLAETRSVDDQAEWVDDQHVAYAVGGAVWDVPADGSGAPSRLIGAAGSPAVVRFGGGGAATA